MSITCRLPLVCLVITSLVIVTGCDQQQPIAAKPAPTPGIKEGETPPVEPEREPQRDRDGSIPVPPATAPATPGEPNHPAAPVLPAPPPTSSATDAPPVAPPPSDRPRNDGAAVTPVPATDPSARPTLPAADGRAVDTQRDTIITSAIYRALSAQPGLSLDGTVITISTSDGQVTLRGAVANDAERDHIAALAGQVDGVRLVDNRLDLTSP